MPAAKTLYLKDAAASGSSHGSLQDGGSAPASANTNTRWTVGTTAATAYARMVYNTAVAAASFGATAQPNSTPTTTDSWRSENPLSGQFKGSQSWALSVELMATGSNQIAAGRLRVRITKGTAVDGSNAVDTDGGQWQTTQVVNLTNTVSQIVTATITESALAFAAEYLFLQCAWEIDGASASGLAALRIKVGSSSTLTTGLFTPDGEIAVAGTIPVATMAATVAETFAATVAATSPVATCAASLTETFAISAAPTWPVATCSASLSEQVAASIAATLPVSTCTATISETFQVAVAASLAAPTCATTLAEVFQLAASASIPAATCAAGLAEEFSFACTAEAPVATCHALLANGIIALPLPLTISVADTACVAVMDGLSLTTTVSDAELIIHEDA